MAAPRYSYYTPAAYAMILGEKFAVSSVRIDYALNSIPQCRLVLPVGRSTVNNKAAPIHNLASELGTQVPIQVYASFAPTRKSDARVAGLGLPADPTVIFDGYTASGGFSRETSGARFILTCNHWLTRLNQASALSDSAHPGNPSRFSYGALMPDATDAGGQDWTVVTKASKYITPGNLAADAWGSAIYPWLTSLTSQNGIWASQVSLKVDGTNAQAAATLARLAPGGPDYQPLAIRPAIALDVDAASEIGKDIANLTHDVSFTANQTLWDILVGHFAADYGFAVVPRVSTALVVPYLGGYRGNTATTGLGEQANQFATIGADQYDAADHPFMMPRPIRAFGVLSSLMTRSGSSGFADDAVDWSTTGFGGWFDAGDANAQGAVIIQQAPRWMGSVTNPSSYAGGSTGASGAPISSAADPAGGTANGSRQAAKARVGNVVKPLLDAYAQVRYAQTVLQGRTLVLSGPCRLDIAPGSLVLVEGAPEQFLDSDQLAAGLIGDVQQVSIVIDAEQPACGTAFHIGNVRTQAENDADTASVARHPLYTNTFLGCALLPPPPT